MQADFKFTVRGFFRNQFCVISKESVRRNGQEQRKHLAFVFASKSASPFMVSEVFAEVGSGPTWVCSLLFVLDTWKNRARSQLVHARLPHLRSALPSFWVCITHHFHSPWAWRNLTWLLLISSGYWVNLHHCHSKSKPLLDVSFPQLSTESDWGFFCIEILWTVGLCLSGSLKFSPEWCQPESQPHRGCCDVSMSQPNPTPLHTRAPTPCQVGVIQPRGQIWLADLVSLPGTLLST